VRSKRAALAHFVVCRRGEGPFCCICATVLEKCAAPGQVRLGDLRDLSSARERCHKNSGTATNSLVLGPPPHCLRHISGFYFCLIFLRWSTAEFVGYPAQRQRVLPERMHRISALRVGV